MAKRTSLYHNDGAWADTQFDETGSRALDALEEIQSLLSDGLTSDQELDWNSIMDNSEYQSANPILDLPAQLARINPPVQKKKIEIPPEPLIDDFDPELTFWDKLLASSRNHKKNQAYYEYENAFKSWVSKAEEIEKINNDTEKLYQKELRQATAAAESLVAQFKIREMEWKEERDSFYKRQKEANREINEFRKLYLNGDPAAINRYCELILDSSSYPKNFPKKFEIDYNPVNKIVVIDYQLPEPNKLPSISASKYIASRKDFRNTYLSESEFAKLYNDTIFQISLRVLHELFQLDLANAISSIVFNGWVEAINKSTGKVVRTCIVSLQAKKSIFQEIDLSNVEAKACFKALKGIASSNLVGIVAIQPILRINKNDKRFVDAQNVLHELDSTLNLAAMNWEDFEHLMRELFELEFNHNGGEVHVTQASRDGGVDAIAYDPDPIRGGKIVIQAKRYTNTVGVSAVRDLFGTVMNEGATKGILVTTADYGPDAYEFAKNKPLTLLNGSNLLFLLEKHGHQARIDLVEAKKLKI